MPAPASPELRHAVIAAYEQDDPVEDIAAEFGVSKQAVSKWAREAGLSRNVMRLRHHAPTVRQQAKRMWTAGLSRAFIARELGVPLETVSTWRKRGNWYVRRDYGARPIAPPAARKRERPRSQRHYACPHCGTRASLPIGHESCQAVAA